MNWTPEYFLSARFHKGPGTWPNLWVSSVVGHPVALLELEPGTTSSSFRASLSLETIDCQGEKPRPNVFSCTWASRD